MSLSTQEFKWVPVKPYKTFWADLQWTNIRHQAAAILLVTKVTTVNYLPPAMLASGMNAIYVWFSSLWCLFNFVNYMTVLLYVLKFEGNFAH